MCRPNRWVYETGAESMVVKLYRSHNELLGRVWSPWLGRQREPEFRSTWVMLSRCSEREMELVVVHLGVRRLLSAMRKIPPVQ